MTMRVEAVQHLDVPVRSYVVDCLRNVARRAAGSVGDQSAEYIAQWNQFSASDNPMVPWFVPSGWIHATEIEAESISEEWAFDLCLSSGMLDLAWLIHHVPRPNIFAELFAMNVDTSSPSLLSYVRWILGLQSFPPPQDSGPADRELALKLLRYAAEANIGAADTLVDLAVKGGDAVGNAARDDVNLLAGVYHCPTIVRALLTSVANHPEDEEIWGEETRWIHHALIAAAASNDPAVLEVLLGISVDQDPRTWEIAICAVGRAIYSHPDSGLGGYLLQVLNNEGSLPVWETASYNALGFAVSVGGKDAVTVLLQVIRRDPEVYDQAGHLPFVWTFLGEDASPDVRLEVREILMTAALESSDLARRTALKSLAWATDESAVCELLLKVLNDPHDPARFWAVEALINDEQPIPRQLSKALQRIGRDPKDPGKGPAKELLAADQGPHRQMVAG